MPRELTPGCLEAAVAGGAILGGGGGGSGELGAGLGRLALSVGDLFLLAPEEISPDKTAITCSLVGAPAAVGSRVLPRDFLRSVQLLMDQLNLDRSEVVLISNENGAAASVNGWWQASALGIDLGDIACNGRAHPTGLMGAMGLNRLGDYCSHQVAVGGNPANDTYCETYASGSLQATAKAVRAAADAACGLVAVARNPVPASYAAEHGAPGAISAAIEVGTAWLEADEGRSRVEAVVAALGAGTIFTGELVQMCLVTRRGFDVGFAEISVDGTQSLKLSVFNEYMVLQGPRGTIARFPDLLCLFDEEGIPVTSAELGGLRGNTFHILAVPGDRLILGAGAVDEDNIRACNELMEELMP